MDIKLHNWIHLAQKIELVGPTHVTAMFPYERLYGNIGNWGNNPCKHEATMLRVFIKLQQALLYQASLDPLTITSIPYPLDPDPLSLAPFPCVPLSHDPDT